MPGGLCLRRLSSSSAWALEVTGMRETLLHSEHRDLGLCALTCCHLHPFPTRLASFSCAWSEDGPVCLTGSGPVEMTLVEILRELKFKGEVLLPTVVSD